MTVTAESYAPLVFTVDDIIRGFPRYSFDRGKGDEPYLARDGAIILCYETGSFPTAEKIYDDVRRAIGELEPLPGIVSCRAAKEAK